MFEFHFHLLIQDQLTGEAKLPPPASPGEHPGGLGIYGKRSPSKLIIGFPVGLLLGLEELLAYGVFDDL